MTFPRTFRRRAVGWKPVIEGGFRFVSRGEADRFLALKDRHPQVQADTAADAALLVCTAPGVTETFRLAGVAKNKHNAKRKQVDGTWFSSGDEARRYVTLRTLERAGEICDLRPHPEFEFVINGVRVGKFTPDFEYVIATGPGRGEAIVEDFKAPSTRTEAYQLRKKLLWACHRIVVTETYR